MTYGEIPVYVDNPSGGRMLRLVRVRMADTYKASEERAVESAKAMGYTNVVLFMQEEQDDDTLDWEYDPSVKDAHR